MKKKIFTILLCTIPYFSYAENVMLNFIETVDWEYMGDNTKFSTDLCSCDVKDSGTGTGAGFRAQIAEPIGLIETTNTPWNVVSIGQKFDKSLTRKQGGSRHDSLNRRYTHFIAFAPMGILNFVQDYVCFERLTSTNFLYWSEIIPTQTSDIMALFAQAAKGPVGKIWYNNPIGAMACIIDCAAATFNSSTNYLHWCAGCAGSTGNNTAYGNGKDEDPITAHHVYALSAIDDLHFAGGLAKISNATFTFSPQAQIPNSMCTPKYFPMAIKTQYALQLAYPTTGHAQSIGKFRTFWAEFKNKPSSEDDVSTWLWVNKDFCIGASQCKSVFTKETNN